MDRADALNARRLCSSADEEEGTEGDDADFGLADWQLDNLWGQLEACTNGQAEELSSGEDDGVSIADSDFGVSDRQVALVNSESAGGHRHGPLGQAAAKKRASTPELPASKLLSQRQVALVDPLQQFANERKDILRQNTPPAPSNTLEQADQKPIKDELDQISSERMERSRLRVESSTRKLRAILGSSRESDSVTWYLLKVSEAGEERYYFKRYSDFQALDKELRKTFLLKPGRTLPNLPKKGIFGLRHKMDIGDFNLKRIQGLRSYVEAIIAQARSLSDDPLLEGFFGKDSPGRILHSRTVLRSTRC